MVSSGFYENRELMEGSMIAQTHHFKGHIYGCTMSGSTGVR